MTARFELAWTDRKVRAAGQTPRHFLDYVVDGESMYERHGHDLISLLGWRPDDEAVLRLTRRLPPDVEDRVAVYVCPEDGDLLCGAVTAFVAREGDEIVWRDLAMSWLDFESGRWLHERQDFADWGDLRFEPAAYWAAITSRSAGPPLGRPSG